MAELPTQPSPSDQVGYHADYDGQEAEYPLIMPYSRRWTDAGGVDSIFADDNEL